MTSHKINRSNRTNATGRKATVRQSAASWSNNRYRYQSVFISAVLYTACISYTFILLFWVIRGNVSHNRINALQMLRNRKLRDNHCLVQNIEDEFHFLMECTKYKFNHKVTLTHIEGLCPNFKRLPPRDKFINILCPRKISIKLQQVYRKQPHVVLQEIEPCWPRRHAKYQKHVT